MIAHPEPCVPVFRFRLSDEARAKMSAAKVGRPLRPEHRAAISDATSRVLKFHWCIRAGVGARHQAHP